MTDAEITALIDGQNGRIEISQIDKIMDYDPTAYGVLYLGGTRHSLKSKWGGQWEFEYKI